MTQTSASGVDRLTPKVIPGEQLVRFGPRIAENAARFADKPCVIDETETVTWAEFGDRVARLAGRLKAMGVGPGSMVMSLAENSAANLIMYAGVLYAGACMVPLPFSATEPALVKMRSDCGGTLLFTTAKYRETAEKLGATQIVDLAGLEAFPGDPPAIAPVEVGEGGVALLVGNRLLKQHRAAFFLRRIG